MTAVISLYADKKINLHLCVAVNLA